MALIDTHAHLTFPELYSQIEAVMDRCTAQGVSQVITVGTDVADAQCALTVARQFPGRVFVAAGFHPHEAAKVSPSCFDTMNSLWECVEVVALGEMGLDYHYDFAPKDIQRKVLAAQLKQAGQLNKPLVIHSREAIDDTIALLEDHGFKDKPVVFHCFTGSTNEAAKLAERGWRISFTGVVTFKKSIELQEIARSCPANQLMVETDSPYLSPVPVRSHRPNEPAFVAHTARFMAKLRGVSETAIAELTTRNARQFFDLPDPNG